MIGPGVTVTAFASVLVQPSALVSVTSSLSPAVQPPPNIALASVPSGLTTTPVPFTDIAGGVVLSVSVTVAPGKKPVPLASSVPPPWQMCVGTTDVTSGGGSTTKLIASVEAQSAGAGLVTTIVYVPTGSEPLVIVIVMPVHSCSPGMTAAATGEQPVIVGVNIELTPPIMVDAISTLGTVVPTTRKFEPVIITV